jgi:hypothetical protein
LCRALTLSDRARFPFEKSELREVADEIVEPGLILGLAPPERHA